MQTARNTAASADLLTRAKTQVDLPGFLALHGWRAVPGKDTARHRLLAEPGGERILVGRAAASGHWVWRNLADTTKRGTIVDACAQLFGLSRGQTYGALRRALQEPPPVLPLARGHTTIAATRPVVEATPRPPRRLGPLGERATAYLTGKRGLDPATLAAFRHRLRSNAHGHLVAPHNDDGDGEERGEGWRSFVGSREDGPRRGRSLWYARPQGGDLTTFILVAESVIDALSAWQRLDADKQRHTLLVSTAGALSGAGKAKLMRLVRETQQERWRAGCRGKVVLADASDVGEAGTQARVDALYALSAYLGAGYERLAPPTGKDWNETLLASPPRLNAQPDEQVRTDAPQIAAYLAPAEDDQVLETPEDQSSPRPSPIHRR